MKHFHFFAFLTIVILSCKKDVIQNGTVSVEDIRQQLKESISEKDFLESDLGSSVLTNYPIERNSVLRTPFKGKSMSTDFILLELLDEKHFKKGTIIHIEIDSSDISTFNGNIKIYSLQREELVSSHISKGVIEALHVVVSVVPVPNESSTLPEIIIVRYIPNETSTMSSMNWYNLQSMLLNSSPSNPSGGASGGYYSESVPPMPTAGGGTGASPVISDDAIFVNFEPVENLVAINLASYLKCFNNISDVGAICTIKLLTDIPVDTDPSSFFAFKKRLTWPYFFAAN